MRKTILGLLLLNVFTLTLLAQNSIIEGYIFEDGNRGYLNTVTVKILEKGTNQLVTNTTTNQEGAFTASVPAGKTYLIEAEKNLFYPQSTTLTIKKGDKNKKVFTKIKMFRKPGYQFEVTLAEKIGPNKTEVDAITGTRIEVYNNTTQKTILDYPNHPKPTFKVNFERGNHYSVLIRKDGFYTKRLEAFVDVKGCILCFEGVGNVQPGVSDVLTEKNKMGTLLANISMQPLVINQSNRFIDLNNVHATYDSALDAATKKELDNLTAIIKDNPNLTFELGVHTDSRGDDRNNVQLSQRRADAMASYINNSNKIQPNQLQAKGYGEQQLLNGCKNEVVCNENLHQQNRRVEWKVIRHVDDNFLARQSLAQIIEVEQFNNGLNFGKQEQFVVRSGQALPQDIANDVQNYNTQNQLITPAANPDGVVNGDLIDPNDPYAEVTNATRLVDENYNDASDREMMKHQPMPTAYKSSVRIDPTIPKTSISGNRDLPSAYETAAANRKIIIPDPQFGETLVASAGNTAKTKSIPAYYTGYKIEFVTALSELPATHEIFKRHGNIAMERKANGIYSYLLGAFTNKDAAETFLSEIMESRYPSADVVFYENGKRIQQISQNKVRTKPVSAPPR